MSTYESSITNPKKQLEFYKQLSEQLQQENKKLSENYDRIYNENCKLREEHNITDISLLDENEKLKQEINNLAKEVDRWNSYYDDEFNENLKLKDNWNKLKEYIRKNIIYDDVGMKILDPSQLEDYIQELEQGSDK